ncbi:AAA family ATPase [[Mycobacterium] nativiensis]|uniref:AAA family ATPase n=1 Tax=[Mycobacterium] nativiensis TaxID=2855503 RepID=A0ABU5XZ61_9MYCO|nr:AAA family ATPase [Mycolicibacter sp. MYC340]MEB3032291.1 AAA family ATPase [Mycolicibacter sp. MYC340]
MGSGGEPAAKRKTSWTLDELWETQFPEVQFLVDGMVPEGLSLLVAAPKVGKSYWLATLIVCLLWDIAPFGKAGVEGRGCDVLLITPDDPSARRLKQRISSIADEFELVRGERKHDLFVEEEWAPIEDGGAEDLDAWLRDHPNCKAVFIDTLDRLRDGGNGTNWMKADERAMAALKMIADAHGVTVVGTHHDRKNKDSDDVLDVVSGGRKITGGVDAILVLKRARNSPYARLQVIGRDVEDVEYHMAFDYPVWTLGERAQDGDSTPKQRTRKDEVLDALREAGKAMTAQAVYDVLREAGSEQSLQHVRQTLSRLKDDGKALRVPRVEGRCGGYRAV